VNVSLTPTLEAFVRERVASGLYNNASEVVREALRRWIAEESRAPRSDPTLATARAETHATQLTRVAPRLRSLGITRAALVGPAAHGNPNPDGEIEVLLDLDPNTRFTVVDLASAKSLCEGALGSPVRAITTGGLDANQRRTLIADALWIY
jgi:antitoxin ParD1/3/4